MTPQTRSLEERMFVSPDASGFAEVVHELIGLAEQCAKTLAIALVYSMFVPGLSIVAIGFLKVRGVLATRSSGDLIMSELGAFGLTLAILCLLTSWDGMPKRVVAGIYWFIGVASFLFATQGLEIFLTTYSAR